MLRAFGDGTDGWLEIEFCGTNLHILVRRDSVKPGGWMSCVGYSQLAAESNRRNATMMVRGAYDFRIRHRAQQIADQRVQLGICDEVSRLGAEKRSSQNPRQAHHRMTAASQTIGRAVLADKLALYTESCRLQRDEIDVPKRRAIHSFAKHDCGILAAME